MHIMSVCVCVHIISMRAYVLATTINCGGNNGFRFSESSLDQTAHGSVVLKDVGSFRQGWAAAVELCWPT